MCLAQIRKHTAEKTEINGGENGGVQLLQLVPVLVDGVTINMISVSVFHTSFDITHCTSHDNYGDYYDAADHSVDTSIRETQTGLIAHRAARRRRKLSWFGPPGFRFRTLPEADCGPQPLYYANVTLQGVLKNTRDSFVRFVWRDDAADIFLSLDFAHDNFSSMRLSERELSKAIRLFEHQGILTTRENPGVDVELSENDPKHHSLRCANSN